MGVIATFTTLTVRTKVNTKLRVMMSENIGPVDWEKSAYIAAQRIKRVRDFCNDAIEYGQYIIRAEDVLRVLDEDE